MACHVWYHSYGTLIRMPVFFVINDDLSSTFNHCTNKIFENLLQTPLISLSQFGDYPDNILLIFFFYNNTIANFHLYEAANNIFIEYGLPAILSLCESVDEK